MNISVSPLAAALVLVPYIGLATAQEAAMAPVMAAPELAAPRIAVAAVATIDESGLVERWVYGPTTNLAAGIGSTTSWMVVSLYEGAHGATRAVMSGTADLGRSTSDMVAGYWTSASETAGRAARDASDAVVTPVMVATTDAAGHLKLTVVDRVAAHADSMATTISEHADSVATAVSGPMLTSRDFAERLKHQSFRDFERVVEKTGFALTGVEVGIGLIPDVSVEFEHVHPLTDAERAEAVEAIREHREKHSGIYAYAQGIILNRLLNASELADDFDIEAVDVHVFPLPGMDIRFDPFEYAKHEEMALENLTDRGASLARREMSTRARLMKLERAFEELAAKDAGVEPMPVAQ